MENRLSQNAAEFNILAENLPFIIARFDKDGRHLFVNSKIKEVTGLDVAEFIGKTNAEIGMPSNLVEAWTENLNKVFISQEAQTNQFTFPGTEHPFYFESKMIPEKNAAGEIETVLVISSDVTEQRLLEMTLRESEEKYHSIFQQSKDGILLTVPDGRILEVNDAACEMLRRNREEVISLGRAGIIAPGENRLEAVLAERGLKGYARAELDCVRGDGTVFPADIRSSLFTDKNGETRTVMFITDIAEVRKNALAQSLLQEQHSNLLESISDAFVSINLQWQYTFANDHALKLLGRTRENLIGKIIWEEFPYAKSQKIYDACQKVMNEKTFTAIEQYDENFGKWFANSIFPSKDGLTILFQDITKRKEVEEALRANEELSRIAIETAGLWVFRQDSQLRYTWSQNADKMVWGIDFIGKVDADFLLADEAEKLTELKKKVMDTLSGAHDEIAIHAPAGLKVYEFFFKPLKDEQNIVRGVIGAMLDVSSRKRTENDLMKSKEQMHLLASHLQEVREEERIHIARELHDDLGQAMTGLKMDLSMLAKKLCHENQEQRAANIKRIELMSSQIDSMVKSVRRIATDLRPTILDYFGLVAAIEMETEEFRKRSGLSCVFSSNVSRIDLQPMQSTAVFRILQEALTNVVRHANASEVLIFLEKIDDYLTLRIQDNGIGIKSDDVSAIHSIGILGMKERALLLGASFDISGQYGAGTIIRLTIPMKGKINEEDNHS